MALCSPLKEGPLLYSPRFHRELNQMMGRWPRQWTASSPGRTFGLWWTSKLLMAPGPAWNACGDWLRWSFTSPNSFNEKESKGFVLKSLLWNFLVQKILGENLVLPPPHPPQKRRGFSEQKRCGPLPTTWSWNFPHNGSPKPWFLHAPRTTQARSLSVSEARSPTWRCINPGRWFSAVVDQPWKFTQSKAHLMKVVFFLEEHHKEWRDCLRLSWVGLVWSYQVCCFFGGAWLEGKIRFSTK